ncbi:MAG: hypothetical protein EHM89_07990, partial [Acidobacteria bacterium]
MRPFAAFLLAVSVVSTSPHPAAQQQSQIVPGVPGQPSPAPPSQGVPLRDPRQTPVPTGTGIIRGRVVSAENGQPIRRARVTANSPEMREGRGTLTDEQGQFELKELPAGRYTLTAMKSGYVALSYGQRRPVETPRPLVLGDKLVLEKIDFHLPRGGVVTGRVLDEFGEPLSEVMVQVSRFRYFGGQRRLLNAGRSNQTDDLGQFRVYGLPPGEYYVSAGMVLGMNQSISGISTGYATTYYPGTPSLSEAQRITIGVGQETSNIVFSLSPARTAKITGRVLSSEGKPVSGVFLMVRQESLDGMVFGGGGAPTRPDGTFELSGITPGDYSIDVRPMNPNPGSGNEPEMASANVTVSGQDISGLTLVMSKGGSARGQIVFDDGKVPQSVRPSAVRLFANSTSFAPMTIPGRSSVKDDWSFEIAGISGERLIRAQLPPGWALKSVIYDGSDVTDRAIDFGTSGELAGLQIVLTQRQTDLSGTVVDLRGNPIKDYVVVVFAEDNVHWIPQTRFIRTGRPDQDGRFTIRGLPPERYLAVAVEYLEPGEETSPETLEQLKSMATSLSLAEG